ncbi:MAG: phenylalanine--tRNA ligase subunit alpha, partial [Geitlerinemataceae cyanobacterium]
MTLSDIEAQLAALRQDAQTAIASADSLDGLEQLRVNYLGKKGQLSKILGGMGKLDPADRPRIGASANQVKETVQSALDDRRTQLQTAQIQAQLASETLDVTMPGIVRSQGRQHPLNSTLDRMVDI